MRVRSLPEILNEPQVRNRNFLHTFNEVSGIKGSVTVPLTPFQLSDSPAQADSPPPLLGQHTNELLADLGYGERDIAELRRRKTI